MRVAAARAGALPPSACAARTPLHARTPAPQTHTTTVPSTVPDRRALSNQQQGEPNNRANNSSSTDASVLVVRRKPAPFVKPEPAPFAPFAPSKSTPCVGNAPAVFVEETSSPFAPRQDGQAPSGQQLGLSNQEEQGRSKSCTPTDAPMLFFGTAPAPFVKPEPAPFARNASAVLAAKPPQTPPTTVPC